MSIYAGNLDIVSAAFKINLPNGVHSGVPCPEVPGLAIWKWCAPGKEMSILFLSFLSLLNGVNMPEMVIGPKNDDA